MENLNASSVLQVENLTKVFDTRSGPFTAVTNVSFQMKKNDFVSLVGPSGCGKSTIIRMLSGIISITSGTATIFGQSYTKKVGGDTLKRLGFIFQSPNLLPWLTVRKNLLLPVEVFGLKDPKYLDNMQNLLRIIDMEDYADAYPSSLSGGMMQRVGVIRAMVHDPDILLMDEPFGALDDYTREQLDMETHSIWERTGKSILFITHNITEAVLMSKRVIVMATDPGRIIREIEIDLPMPRTLDIIKTEQFMRYEDQIRQCIGAIDLEKIV